MAVEIQSQEQLDELLATNEKVLVDFWAQWCGPCKMLLPLVEALDAPGVLVVKVNADDRPEIADKYGVRGLPTLKTFRNGTLNGTKVGAMAKGQLLAFVDTNLGDDKVDVEL